LHDKQQQQDDSTRDHAKPSSVIIKIKTAYVTWDFIASRETARARNSNNKLAQLHAVMIEAMETLQKKNGGKGN